MGKGYVIGSMVTCLLLVSAANNVAAGPQCVIAQERFFTAGKEKVRLARRQGLDVAANVGLFKAPLAVNTDGAPTSYHPADFKGESLAINRIDHGIAISSTTDKKLTPQKKSEIFDEWRKSEDWTVPAGYHIGWRNVIAADAAGKPCVFRNDYAGYFGSLTALKNGLAPKDVGECQVKNQLDQRFIPAIVLRGNANPLKHYGAKKGDLVLAVNPGNGVIIPGVIGDTGDGNRIGEGSVALNMALLKKSEQPKTYPEALRLDTGKEDMIIAVLPGSDLYKRERPYTAENIAKRVEAWATEQGYGTLDEMAAAMMVCAEGL